MPVEDQLVQAFHAGAEAGREHYTEEHGICRAVILSVPDKPALEIWHEKLLDAGIGVSAFIEPDDGLGLTAICTGPLAARERRGLRRLPLWRPPRLAVDAS